MKMLLRFFRHSLRFQATVLALLLPGLSLLPSGLRANPSGGIVTHGVVEIGDGLNGQLSINQLSQKAIINWQDFSIGAGELTRFLQPSSDSAALNRVVSGNPSAIHGALQANGKLFLINPNGILVGAGGSIDTGGLVLSTLDVADADFLGGGDLIFRGSSQAGVQNFGRINAIGGDVFLIGNSVTNAGTITATGTVGLAAGEEVLVTANPDANGERVFVRPVGGGNGINNSGSIEGAAVELKAHGNLYALAINNSGSIRATGASRSGGGVYLRAPGGRIDNSGSIRATLPGGDGGRILIEGAMVNAGGTIDASGIGQGKGGEVTLSGEEISVTGRVAADGSEGGTVVIGGPGSRVDVSGSAEVSADGFASGGGSVSIAGAAVSVANGGAVRADGESVGGSVTIGGTASNEFAGSLSVVGGNEGGSARLVGDAIRIAESARIDASGGFGGGSIEIGGGFGGRDPEIVNASSLVIADGAKLTSDALVAGNGGRIVVWSDGDTTFAGEVRALGAGAGRGGFVEVSGRENLNIDGGSFELGANGFLLLDPSNFTVTDTVRNAILPTLNAGTDVVIFTNGSDAAAGNGDIVMSSNFSGTSAIAGDGSLSLLAYGDLFIRRDLVSNGGGNLNLVAGWDGTTPSSFGPGAAGNDTSGAPVIDMDSQIFADTSTYGNRDGSVYVGLETDKSTPVNQSTTTVGSRAGDTNVAGYNLVMVGDNTDASTSGDNRRVQLGYRPGDVDVSLGRDAASGRIKVNVLNDVSLTAGMKTNATESPSGTPGQYNSVRIGHGGRDATDNGYNHSGDIIVQAGLGSGAGITGNIIGTAGKNLAGFVQIGHGGHGGGASAGSFAGNILVEAGDSGRVEFTAGAGRRAFAQIGHGGYDVDAGVTVPGSVGYHSGDITVRAGTDVLFHGGTGATQFVTDSASYAMIGHGGFGSQSRSDVQGHTGDIVVEAGAGGVSGGVLFDSGDLDNNFTQIGHGGRSSQSGTGANGHEGDISVSSIGDITFRAGTGQLFRGDNDGQIYTQLGHGGWDASVNLNVLLPAGSTQGHHGDISVVSTAGSISFNGGDVLLGSAGEGLGRFHYAQLGHGGYSAEGNHYGNIEVRAGVAADGALLNGNSEIRFSAGSTNDNSLETYNYAQLGHGGAFARGNQGWGDHDGDGQADGDLTVKAGGDIVLNGGQFFDPSSSTGRDENRRSYVQIGNGGFDSDDFNPGNDAASVLMPDGNLYLFDGYGLGGPTAAERIGNQGDIFVESVDGSVRMQSGQTHDSYGIVGHGGGTSQGSSDGDNSGNITVLADADGSNRAGGGGDLLFWVDDPSDANLTDNIYDRRYVQLGHGGHYVSGGHTGDILVQAGNLLEFRAGGGDSYAQLGHGGRNDHRLNVARITATTSDDRDTDARYDTVGVSNQSPPDDRRDNANDRYFAGTHSGDITVTAWGDIHFIGYSNPDANDGGVGYAQVGHGGFRNAADPLSANGLGHNGDITMLAGGLTFDGAGLVTAAENPDAAITFESGMQNFSYAQLGHGGYEAFGNHSGDITVAAAAGIDFHARGGSDTFTDNRAGQYSYLQIGHGGINAEFAPYLPRALESTSSTVANVFSENPANNPYYAYVTAGGFLPEAGTIDFDGDTQPDPIGQGSLMPLTTFNQVYVDPSTIRFVDHDLDPGTAMIPIIPTNRGQWFHINAPGAPVDGNGDYILGNSGDISVVAMKGDINLQSATSNSLRGREEYVMVGHGGLYTGGDHTGDISVIAQDGNINLLAGQATTGDQALNSFVQIGHGGSWSGGTVSGDITVAARGTGHAITALAGIDNQTYVQIGHGGYDASFLSGAANQISGPDANGVVQSDTRPGISTETRGHNLQYWYNPGFVRRTEYVSPFGDNAASAGAGIEFRRSFSGDIHVEATDGITFAATPAGSATSNAAPGAYAQIGHGGRSTEADTIGEIYVNAGSGALLFDAGQSNQAYAQLGHGGYESDGNKSGNITVLAGTGTGGEGVEFRAGSRVDAYAMLGHGGTNAKSAARDANDPTVPIFRGNAGAISVNAGGDITFVAGTGNYLNSDEDGRIYVQLGHGGYDADVHFTTSTDVFGTGIGHHGDISVNTDGGRVFFAAGDVGRADNPSLGLGEGRFHFAHLGHGGYESRGEHYGSIDVDAAGDIIFLGGTSEDNDGDRYNFAQLGHGGGVSRGNHGRAGESIDVRAGGDIVFASGSSQAAYSQLGHGGAFARGDHQGDIWVSAGGDIAFSGVMGRHQVTDEEKNYDLSRATNNGTQTSDNLYTLEGSNVIPGTLVITIPGGPLLGDDGNGNVVVTGGNLDLDGDTSDDLVVGQVVASIVYTSGLLTFNTDVNPNNVASPSSALLTTASYESLEIGTAYTQLGHGGYDSENGSNLTDGNVGNIGVDAGGDIVFTAGVGAGAYAQVGHGGYASPGRNVGNITFGTDRDGIAGTADDRIGGAVSLAGGQGEYFAATNAYAKIGHGGRDSSGTNTGDITIRSTSGIDGSLTGVGLQLRAGTREDASAQVGHGGVNGNSGLGNDAANMEGHSGNIFIDTHGSVNLVGGVLNMAGAPLTSLNADGRLFAMIGHGGYDADTSLNGVLGYGDIGHHGDITVISREGSVNVLAGDETRAFLPSFAPTTSPFDVTGLGLPLAGGRFHWAQIGHGGYVSSGNHYGNIVVHAGFDENAQVTGAGGNDVLLMGGRNGADDDSGQGYAQIGHGGRSAGGNQGRADEVVSVMAYGDVTLRGGDGTDAYAQIGHGGTQARGDRQGTVQVFAEGDVSLLASQFPGTILPGEGITGRYFYNATSVNNNRYSLDRASDLLAGDGQVAGRALFRLDRVTPGTVWFEIFDDAGNKLGELADPDGDGSLTVVADFSADMDGDTVPENFVAGQVVGTFNYAPNATRVDFTVDVNPGSDGGAPNLVANFEYARTDRAFAHIGHGGYDADNPDGNVELGDSGDIRVTARTGSISAQAGTDSRSYVQFGHGGWGTRGANTGDIVLRAAGDFSLVGGTGGVVDDDKALFALVGHGGWDADGTNLSGAGHSGDIMVSSGSGALSTAGVGDGVGDFLDLGDFDRDGFADVIAFGADVSGNAGGLGSGVGILLQGGSGVVNDDDAFAMIGHGGRSSDGAHQGNIGVSATRGISLLGGSAYRSWAQVGHGGLASNGDLAGLISVISTGGDLTLAAGSGVEAYAMIGHGDDRVTDATLNSTGTRGGDILVEVNDWSLTPNTTRVAQIGHRSRNANEGLVAPTGLQLIATGTGGSVNSLTDVIRDASILPYLASGGDVVFGGINLAIDSAVNYASAGNLTFLSTQGMAFHRSVENAGAGAVNALAGWDRVSGFDQALDFGDHPPVHTFDYAALKADLDGGGNPDWFGSAVSGDPGWITMDASNGSLSVGSRLGRTSFAAHGVALTGGDGAGEFAQVGTHNDGTSAADGRIDIDTKEGGLTLTGGSAVGAFAQVGHGGRDGNTGDADADQQGAIGIDVTHGNAAGAIELFGGSAAEAYSQIGNGGLGQQGSHGGDITLDADRLVMDAGTAASAYVQVGHGGASALSNLSGNLDIRTASDLVLNGGNTAGAYAQVGHGGQDHRGTKTGDIALLAPSLSLVGGNQGGYAQVGSGGFGSGGNIASSVSVNTSGPISLVAGGADAYALIGGGGSQSGNLAIIDGDLLVQSQAGPITLSGGDTRAFAQIGNGGLEYHGEKYGNLRVQSGGDVVLGAGGGEQSYTQIGHGGFFSSGFAYGRAGEILEVTAAGDIRLAGSDTGANASAQIGHGGGAVNATLIAGDVEVSSQGDLVLVGGGAEVAFAQVGNGGAGANAAKRGDTFAHAGQSVTLEGGDGRDAYAKIGQGDWMRTPLDGVVGSYTGTGSLLGNVQVTAGEDVVLDNAMIGGLDPTFVTVAAALGGDTFVAVSRNDPTATGTGVFSGDANSLIASAPSGQLRLYLPTRVSNQLADTRLNTTVYPGPTLPEPSPQTLDEFVLHQVLPDASVAASPMEHANLADLVSGDPRWLANLDDSTLTSDTANYRTGTWGNYSLYYDTIMVEEAAAPVAGPIWSLPNVPGDGGAGGAGGGEVDPGDGVLPGDGGGFPIVPVSPIDLDQLVFGLLFDRFSDLDASVGMGAEVSFLLDDAFQDDEPSNQRKKTRKRYVPRPQYRYVGDREGWNSADVFYEFDPEIDVNAIGPVVDQ